MKTFNFENEELIGVATQIVFEYINWGSEHISEMMDTYEDGAPFTYDQLEDMTNLAEEAKQSGLSYHETIDKLIN